MLLLWLQWKTYELEQVKKLTRNNCNNKNSPLSTTDQWPKWINTYRKLRYQNGWPKGRPPWSRETLSKEPLQTSIDLLCAYWWCGKLLTAQIREIHYSLISHKLFSKEQKGCGKGTKGTRELLYIDQHILNESKTRQKNLAKAWIDNKEAYDMVP